MKTNAKLRHEIIYVGTVFSEFKLVKLALITLVNSSKYLSANFKKETQDRHETRMRNHLGVENTLHDKVI